NTGTFITDPNSVAPIEVWIRFQLIGGDHIRSLCEEGLTGLCIGSAELAAADKMAEQYAYAKGQSESYKAQMRAARRGSAEYAEAYKEYERWRRLAISYRKAEREHRREADRLIRDFKLVVPPAPKAPSQPPAPPKAEQDQTDQSATQPSDKGS
ncbi:MAG: hypothetical protein D6808_07385, partial [Candidatus Dadabacteria bacterium]